MRDAAEFVGIGMRRSARTVTIWVGVALSVWLATYLRSAYGNGRSLVPATDSGLLTGFVLGWAIAATVGVGFVGPELGRIDRAAQAHGPDSAEVQRRVRRLFTVFRFDTALLILIVLDMTAKPSF